MTNSLVQQGFTVTAESGGELPSGTRLESLTETAVLHGFANLRMNNFKGRWNINPTGANATHDGVSCSTYICLIAGGARVPRMSGHVARMRDVPPEQRPGRLRTKHAKKFKRRRRLPHASWLAAAVAARQSGAQLYSAHCSAMKAININGAKMSMQCRNKVFASL